MAKRSTSLAAQVAELRTLVEQHVQRTKPHCCVRVIYPEHTPEDEIEALKLKAAAEKGVDPDQVTWWLMIEIVKPKPCVEPPREQTTAPVAGDNVLAERRPAFARRPDATVIEPERPMPLDYPDTGLV